MTPSTTLTWSTREFPAPTSPSSTTPPLSLTTPSTTLVWTRSSSISNLLMLFQTKTKFLSNPSQFLTTLFMSSQLCASSCRLSKLHNSQLLLSTLPQPSTMPPPSTTPPLPSPTVSTLPLSPSLLLTTPLSRDKFWTSFSLVLWRPTMRQHWLIGNVRNYLFLFMK